MMGYFALGRGRMESGPLGVFLLPGERVAGLVSAGAEARRGAARGTRRRHGGGLPGPPAAAATPALSRRAVQRSR